jgi:hypothetical protein
VTTATFVKHPTIQLVLDFSKHNVWPFYSAGDHKRMKQLIVELKLGPNQPLGPFELRHIFTEYHKGLRPEMLTEKNLEKFVSLVFETRQEFCDTLKKEAVVNLNREGHAPLRPYSMEIK